MARSNDNTQKKAIRLSIVRTIRQKGTLFQRSKREEKQQILQQAAAEHLDGLADESQFEHAYTEKSLTGVEELSPDVMTLQEMGEFIENHQKLVLRFESPARRRAIGDPFLQKLDRLLDDEIVDALLASSAFCRSKRTWLPSQLLRLELLRSYRFSEWSVREFSRYMASVHRREERAFCRLPLNRSTMCDHSVMSRFRSSLTMEMRINLSVYFLHFFLKSGHLGDRRMFMVDSTDVAIPINDTPIFKVKAADGSYIRFYSDLDADAGARRRKRDKSNRFIGYRVHTITVGDMDRGIAYPVVSLTAAASHNDSLLLDPLIEIVQAMGLTINVLSADKAYVNSSRTVRMKKECDMLTVTPPVGNAVIPENVNHQTGAVFMNSDCNTPMRWRGFDEEDDMHVFKCDGDHNCLNSPACSRERLLKMDTGLFGAVPRCSKYHGAPLFHRRIAERPFNLMKHKDGLEPCRMKTHRTVAAQVVFCQIVGLTHVMAGLRANGIRRESNTQEVLPLANTN